MNQEFADTARLAAEQLSSEYKDGSEIIDEVEKQLAGRRQSSNKYDVATAISISTAVVNVLKFLWDVSKDIRDIRAKKRADLEARILTEASWPSGMSPDDREKVVEAALDAIKAG